MLRLLLAYICRAKFIDRRQHPPGHVVEARYPVSQCRTPVDDHLLSRLAHPFRPSTTRNHHPCSSTGKEITASTHHPSPSFSTPPVPDFEIYFRRNEHPSVSRALPPVGWQSTVEQPPQMTTVWACEKTVVMVKQPGHLTSMKKERGAGTRV